MPQELSESEMFVLLANRRRRLAVRILRESTAPTPVIELARRITNRESTDPEPEAVAKVYLTLYHHHLPRLDDAGVVEYDADEGTVRPGVNFTPLVHVVERVRDRELPWSDE